ncbi:MAG: acetyl-CoA carboxylase biotin carboxylase subunit [bacterium]
MSPRPPQPLKRVLIANRGEIAVRIIRACHELGIEAIAVYSEADRDALHVRLADAAYFIGPAPANESYLVMDKILEVAKKSKADSVHPGYGFLAESAEFAERAIKAGLVYIGPSPRAIADMGNKTVAKQTAKAAGLPCVPGDDKFLHTLEEAARVAANIGYPVMLKAAMGGGGRGMRLVTEPGGLESAFRSARSEAKAAFGDDSVYLEKYINEPRHIEFQVFGDLYGNVIHLGERDCTLQRRHQKLLEEAPSPYLDEDLRARMGAEAVKIAKAVNYAGAGTVEFLVDSQKNFFFMEMNTRIQVEHPVTELVTGLDLIREMILVAGGTPLSIKQEDVKINGWAIEVRINAEDPFRNFTPNPGLIQKLRFPSGGGVRVDSAAFQGYTIPRQYDSMIAKIITHGPDRTSAIRKMLQALEELQVKGIRTTQAFHTAILQTEDFAKANYDTNYIGKHLETLLANFHADEELAAVATAVEVFMYTKSNPAPDKTAKSRNGNGKVGAWRQAARLGSLNHNG